MGWLEVDKWAYGPQGERRGPFSKKEIRDLIERGVITPETRLSRYNKKNDYSGVDDYPVIKTEFSVYFPREVFIDATKDDPVPDCYMWLGLFVPLFFLTIVYFREREPLNISFIFISLGVLLSLFLFWYADLNAMSQRGYLQSTRARIYVMACFYACIICQFYNFTVLSLIVYFYFRNKQLRRSLAPIWVALAYFLLITGMSDAWPRIDKIYPVSQYWE